MNIIYHHHPKTAGTSLIKSFGKTCDSFRICHQGFCPSNRSNFFKKKRKIVATDYFKSIFSGKTTSKIKIDDWKIIRLYLQPKPSKHTFFASHEAFENYKTTPLVNNKEFYFTIIRHPLDRFLSQIYYSKMQIEKAPNVLRSWFGERHFKHHADMFSKDMPTLIKWLLEDESRKECSVDFYKNLQAFHFVGVHEYLKESIQVIADTVNIEIPLSFENKSPEKFKDPKDRNILIDVASGYFDEAIEIYEEVAEDFKLKY